MFGDDGFDSGGQSADFLDESEIVRIRERMDSRRDVMRQQIQADAIKSALCDKIQNHKSSITGISRKLRLLEKNDPELYKYIRYLEFINKGIWCSKCNKLKNIGVYGPSKSDHINDYLSEIESMNDTADRIQSILSDNVAKLRDYISSVKSVIAGVKNSVDIEVINDPNETFDTPPSSPTCVELASNDLIENHNIGKYISSDELLS